MKLFFALLVAAIVLFKCIPTAHAQSTYVLPYPGTMPGSIWYKLHLVQERLLAYWYFGSFGQFTYTLSLSDKYLVEAKTLFEYQQYLLGYNALQKSDNYFKKVNPFLIKAAEEGKDIKEKRSILKNAARKHIEVLQNILNNTPSIVNWRPEKLAPTTIYLKDDLNVSLKLRQVDL
jgi:hypothetical protein